MLTCSYKTKWCTDSMQYPPNSSITLFIKRNEYHTNPKIHKEPVNIQTAKRVKRYTYRYLPKFKFFSISLYLFFYFFISLVFIYVFIFFYYSYVHTRLGSFLNPASTPSLATHSAASLSPPPPQYPAETIWPLFLILL
jgi:hypothetical protein